MTKAACSIIISTYNWPAALRLCFQSVLKQSVLPSEIIVADDGSKEETRELIEHFTSYSVVPVIHVWQPDEGFQLAKIRNKAIAKASQPYIVQVDGDLILHPHFLEDHLHLRENGYFISGSRVLLSKETSHVLLTKQSINVQRHYIGNKNFFNRFRNKLLRNILSTRYKVRGKNAYYVKGCNMSFWRRDLLKVNGYNEDFTGWGREDSELAIRLMNAGINKKFLKMGGVTYHVYHKEASRELEQENTRLLERSIEEKKVFAEKGIDQYL
jgi:glycosyltransferase involved in cell wall biosynthesis